jgi:hypothetical protein
MATSTKDAATVADHPARKFTFKVGDHKANLRPVLPLKMMQWEQLEDLGISVDAMSEGIKKMSLLRAMAQVVLQAANDAITEDDVKTNLGLREINEITTLIFTIESEEGSGVGDKERPT